MGKTLGESGWAHEDDSADRRHVKAGGHGAEEIQKGGSSTELWRQGFEILMNSMDVTVIAGDSGGRIVAASKSIANLLGLRSEEILGGQIYDLPWGDSEGLSMALRTRRSQGSTSAPLVVRTTLDHKDGRAVAVEVSVVGADVAEGCRGVVLTLRATADPSEPSEHPEPSLDWHEGTFEHCRDAVFIFENSVLGMYRTTPDGRILMANSSLRRMLGFDNSTELMARNLEEEGFEPEYPRSNFKAKMQADGKVVGLESAWRRHDGSTLWVRENAKAVRDRNGEILFYEGTVEDVTQQREAQEALLSSQERLARVIEGTDDGIWEWPDVSSNEFWWSPRLYELLGYEAGRFTPTLEAFEKLLHPDDRSLAVAGARSCLESSGPFESECRVRTKSGAYRWFHVRGRCFGDPSGEARCLAGSVRDITEQKKVGKALQDSERRLQATIRAANLGIWEWDMRTQEVKIGGNHERLLGFAPGEFDGRAESFYRRVHPEDLHLLEDATAEAIHKRADCLTEFRVVWPDGSVHWIAGRGRIERDENDQPARMLGAFQDITERKCVVEALIRSEQKYRQLFNLSPESIVLLDGQGIILEVNPRFTQWMESDRETFLGKCGFDLPKVPDETRGQLIEMFEQLKQGAILEPYEVPFLSASGAVRFGRILGAPVLDDSGGFLYMLLMVQDITARKEAEERVVRYQDKLKALTTELSLAEERERRRIGIGLHDHVGQALVMTKFSLQALGVKAHPSISGDLKGICSQIDKLMDEIRSLSFELSDSVLYEVGLPEAMEAYLVRKVQTKHGLVCKLQCEGDFSVLDDDVKLVLFRNLRELLANVTRHADAMRVWVRLAVSSGMVTAEVRDDGVGFEPEVSEAAAGERQSHFGLFSVREQLACFGGRLEIQSKPDQGTCVTMKVPLPN